MTIKRVRLAVLIAVLALPLIAAPALAKKGPPAVETTNNLSFPVVAADGFAVPALTSPVDSQTGLPLNPWLNSVYDSDPLTEGVQPILLDGLPCYAQKVPDNKWQAAFAAAGDTAVGVFGVDWGDNIESVYPFVRRPYRLELVLYEQASEWSAIAPGGAGNAFKMALLANPSSPDEIQGTNGSRYDSAYATVVTSPTYAKLVIQDITNYDALTWTGARWVSASDPADVPAVTTVGFGPELNVAGKYIFGGSSGGWKPTRAGTFRVTFYLPGSRVSLATAGLGDLGEDGAWVPASVPPAIIASEEGDEEVPKAVPVIDGANNITFVDLAVQPRR